MSLEELIASYGYTAIAVGTFLEGETILVLGGLAAHRGYLELKWVVGSAFLGTLTGDQIFFHIGRIWGRSLLQGRPGWKAKSEKVLSLMKRHQVLLILGFRFLYGLRTVTPFVLGASGIPRLRFAVLNGVGALVWALIVGFLGYFVGHAVEVIIGDVKRYEMWLFAGVLAVGVSVWSWCLLRKR
jgi:membrane protein DedA with SNARE-associated domain